MALAADVMQPLAESAGVALSVSPEPAHLFADPDRIIQTFTNLVGNAIKFSPRGGTVRMEAERQGDQMLLRVIDHGRGIPQDKLESIFGRFAQVDASDSRRKGGTGLGLFICRTSSSSTAGAFGPRARPARAARFSSPCRWGLEQKATQHRQAIAVHPATRSLCRSRAWTPWHLGPLPGISRASAPVHRKGAVLPNRHVLIIDDEEDIREIAKVSLETVAGWEALTAASGAEGVEAARREQRVDAILLDVQMPEMDGLATFKRLQAGDRTRKIPVIMLTAQVQSTDRRLFASLGVAAVIPKPFDPLKLAAQVACALGWN